MNQIITTEDGSTTIYISEIDETYHSSFGAINESKHIFIDAGLLHCNKKDISILEVGFGTGLNAFLTLLETKLRTINITYTTFELFPLDKDILSKLNFKFNSHTQELFNLIHNAQWGKLTNITQNFSIQKIKADFTKTEQLPIFDVCYFDAFSPQKQPYMWDIGIFERLFSYANRNAILTTYCAKGEVRRNLQKVGFVVERLPGPKGKREILRGTKQCI